MQIGVANRAVTAPNSGTINLGDSHHHYNKPGPTQPMKFEPTGAEIEILTRLAESKKGYLNFVTFDGGVEVLIEGRPLGGSGGGEPSVQLYEAVQRLLCNGLLSDLQRNGEVYHISTKGRDAARQIREQIDRGERPDYGHIERTMPDLLREMREDFGKCPVVRELIIMDSKDELYNGRGVLVYYRSVHPDLDGMFQVLENIGIVQNITHNNTGRYRVSEAFARYLQDKG